MWTQTEVAGKCVEVFTPVDAHACCAVIYLHGHGVERLSQRPEVTRLFEKYQLRVAAPTGGRSWWLDRICNEFDETMTPSGFVTQHLIPWIGEHWRVQPPGIGLLGVSMGGQGALNISYRAARQLPCVAAVSPAIDFHSVYGQGFTLDEMFSSMEQARQETATLNIHPLNWPKFQYFCCDPLDATWFAGCERLASKLASMGIPFESDLTTSLGGHNWNYFSQMLDKAIAFLKKSLQEVSSGAETGQAKS